MADDKKKGALDEAAIEREREWNARVDWFLQSLVEMVNSSKTAMSFGITISVGGVLISGELVGGQHYFESFGAQFTGNFNDDKMAASVKDSFAKLGDIYRQGLSQDEKSPSGEALGPSYIHLRNARFAGKPSSPGTWWRGKLSAVDGFSLGQLKDE